MPGGASPVANVGPPLGGSGALRRVIVSSSSFTRALSRSISSCNSCVSLSMNLYRGLVRIGTKEDSWCQHDLPSALSGPELTVWAYTLTPTADTSIAWSAQGSKAGLDVETRLTPFYYTARPNENSKTAKALALRLTLSFKRLHSAPESIGQVRPHHHQVAERTSRREHFGFTLPGSGHGLGSKVVTVNSKRTRQMVRCVARIVAEPRITSAIGPCALLINFVHVVPPVFTLPRVVLGSGETLPDWDGLVPLIRNLNVLSEVVRRIQSGHISKVIYAQRRALKPPVHIPQHRSLTVTKNEFRNTEAIAVPTAERFNFSRS